MSILICLRVHIRSNILIGRRLFIFSFTEYVAHNLCWQIRADDNSSTCTFTTGRSVTCTGACANEIITNRQIARLFTKRKKDVVLELKLGVCSIYFLWYTKPYPTNISLQLHHCDRNMSTVENYPIYCSVTERLGPSVCEQKGRRLYNVVAW